MNSLVKSLLLLVMGLVVSFNSFAQVPINLFTNDATSVSSVPSSSDPAKNGYQQFADQFQPLNTLVNVFDVSRLNAISVGVIPNPFPNPFANDFVGPVITLNNQYNLPAYSTTTGVKLECGILNGTFYCENRQDQIVLRQAKCYSNLYEFIGQVEGAVNVNAGLSHAKAIVQAAKLLASLKEAAQDSTNKYALLLKLGGNNAFYTWHTKQNNPASTKRWFNGGWNRLGFLHGYGWQSTYSTAMFYEQRFDQNNYHFFNDLAFVYNPRTGLSSRIDIVTDYIGPFRIALSATTNIIAGSVSDTLKTLSARNKTIDSKSLQQRMLFGNGGNIAIPIETPLYTYCDKKQNFRIFWVARTIFSTDIDTTKDLGFTNHKISFDTELMASLRFYKGTFAIYGSVKPIVYLGSPSFYDRLDFVDNEGQRGPGTNPTFLQIVVGLKTKSGIGIFGRVTKGIGNRLSSDFIDKVQPDVVFGLTGGL